MAGPTLTGLLQTAGIAPGQTAGKQVDAKKKDSDQPKVALDGDEADSAKSTSEAAAKTAKKQNAKEAKKGEAEGSPQGVKRRRVKLKDLAQREVAKETGGQQAQKSDKTTKTNKANEAKQKGDADQAHHLEEQHFGEVDKAQEAAKAKANLGIRKAQGRLMEQSRFNQSSVKYEMARHAQDNGQQQGLSKTGQQKWMLNNLCSMLNICVEQHTGGKAGEAFESRRDTRLIFMALRGLRDGNGKTDQTASSTPRSLSRGEFEAKQKKAELIFTNIIEPVTRPDTLPEYSEVA